MSASPSFTVEPQVVSEWQRAIKHDKPYRCLQLMFQPAGGETLHLVKTFPSSNSCARDFEAVRDSTDEQQGCYYLFRIEDSNAWNLISYVPEDAMATQNKMLYAVSKSGLKGKLGVGYFGEDWHVNSKKGFTYINYKNETTSKKEVSYSEGEKVLMNGLREEEAERTRQLSDPSLKGKSGINQVAGPLDGDAQREIQRYKSGEVSLIRIGIDNNERLCLEESKRVSSYEDVKSSLAPGVPGFYLFSLRGGGSSSNVFLYYCPEKSPKNTRLVYATRMKSVRDNIQALGVHITKSVEMQDAKELEAKVTERNIPAYEYRESAKATTATTSSKVDKPHPLFGGGQGGPMKKKVVIPPPGAW